MAKRTFFKHFQTFLLNMPQLVKIFKTAVSTVHKDDNSSCVKSFKNQSGVKKVQLYFFHFIKSTPDLILVIRAIMRKTESHCWNDLFR